MRKLLLVPLLLAALILLTAGSASALANPGNISIHDVKVFEGVWYDGDALFVATYDIEYSPEPASDCSDNFIFSILEGGNASLIVPVATCTDYQEDIVSKYRTAAQAASEVTWGTAYRARVGGSPLVFPILTEDVNMDTRTLSGSDWITGEQDYVREELRKWCITQAEWFESQVANLTILITGVPDVGKALNAAGKVMFLDGVPNLDSAVPLLFQTATGTDPVEPSDPTGAYEDETTLANMLGQPISDAFDGIGDYFGGISGQTTAGMFWGLIVLMGAALVFVYSGNTTAAMLLMAPLMIMGAYLGFIPLAALFVIVFMLAMYALYNMYLIRV